MTVVRRRRIGFVATAGEPNLTRQFKMILPITKLKHWQIIAEVFPIV